MNTIMSTLPRVLFAGLFASVCFTVGYLAPHNRAALAQAPTPTPSVPFDNVPGGVHGHGLTLITAASTTLIGGKPVAAWPCSQSDKCNLEFRFRFEPPPNKPAAFRCPGQVPDHCITFTGDSKDFSVDSDDPDGTHHPEGGTDTPANVAGIIQLIK